MAKKNKQSRLSNTPTLCDLNELTELAMRGATFDKSVAAIKIETHMALQDTDDEGMTSAWYGLIIRSVDKNGKHSVINTLPVYRSGGDGGLRGDQRAPFCIRPYFSHEAGAGGLAKRGSVTTFRVGKKGGCNVKKVFLSSIRRDAKRLGIDITAFLDNSDNYTIEELNFVRKQLENAVFLVEASINSLKVLEQKTPQHLPNPSNRLSGKPSLPKWGDDLLPPYGNGYK